MVKYVLKRFLSLIPVLIGVTFIVFLIMTLSPGDPARVILGDSATEENVEQLRDELGLNDNVIIQYGRYMTNLLKGDMGISYKNGKSVSQEVMSRYPNTLKITILAMVIGVTFSIPIGVISATRQYSIYDNLSMFMALLGVSMPSFWLGLMLILLFSVELGWLPSGGSVGFRSMILPAITIGVSTMASITRTTRSSMLEVIRQDYIRTARAKGIPRKKIIREHALRSALIPTVTVIGLQFGYLMGGAVLTETVFAWPGVGRLMVDSISAKDTPMVLGSIISLSVTFSLVNLTIDSLYVFIDPRLKSQYM